MTSVTTDQLVVSTSSDTNPMLRLDSTGCTSDHAILLSFDPTAVDSASGLFRLNYGRFNVNTPASSRYDSVWTLGYNVDWGGGRIVSTEPALSINFENYYINGGVSGNPAWSEWHLQYTDTSGNGRRPLSFQMPRVPGTPCWGFYTADIVSFQDWATNSQRIKYNFINSTFTNIEHPVQAQYLFNVNNTPIMRQLNAAGTSYLSFPFYDSSNKFNVSTPTIFSTTSVSMSGLPTSDPHVVWELWSNNGVVTVSQG